MRICVHTCARVHLIPHESLPRSRQSSPRPYSPVACYVWSMFSGTPNCGLADFCRNRRRRNLNHHQHHRQCNRRHRRLNLNRTPRRNCYNSHSNNYSDNKGRKGALDRHRQCVLPSFFNHECRVSLFPSLPETSSPSHRCTRIRPHLQPTQNESLHTKQHYHRRSCSTHPITHPLNDVHLPREATNQANQPPTKVITTAFKGTSSTKTRE